MWKYHTQYRRFLDDNILNMICINGVWVWVHEYYTMLSAYQVMMKGTKVNLYG